MSDTSSGLTDQFGNAVEPDTSKLPEDSPAATGDIKPPSGQGGASPHDGLSYQDKFSPNPEPSESAAEKGAENDAVAKGEKSAVDLHNERIAGLTGQQPEPGPGPEPEPEPEPEY